MAWWVFGTIGFLVTAATGFVAGMVFAKGAVKRAVNRARRSLNDLYGMVVDSFSSTRDVCEMLEKFPKLRLSEAQLKQLETERSGLLEQVERIVDQQMEILAEEIRPQPVAEPVTLEWTREPVDPVTNLPDRTAFDANLETMLKACADSDSQGALMLVKIDKLEHLRQRFKVVGVSEFKRRMAGLICLSLRDDDLVCQYNDAMFGVLMPTIDDATGRRLAETIRSTIRNHLFRLEEGGGEILVTASFGYTSCDPLDNPLLLLNRAGTALSKSERKGRNQLHVHDGETANLCLAR